MKAQVRRHPWQGLLPGAVAQLWQLSGLECEQLNDEPCRHLLPKVGSLLFSRVRLEVWY